jgi:hypothetical protein
MEVDGAGAAPVGTSDDLYGVLMGYCGERYPGLNEEALHRVIARFRVSTVMELWGPELSGTELSGAELWEQYKGVTSESDLHTSVRLPVDGIVAHLFPSAAVAGGGGG